MEKRTLIVLLALMLICSTSFAAEAALAITSYSSTPAEVYPGTFGYMQMKLTNNGDATAQSVTAYYNIDGVTQQIFANDIGAGSSAQILVPFRILQESAGGIQLLKVDIYYGYQKGTVTSTKTTSVSIPIQVSQLNPLEVRTISIDKSSIAAGEKITLELELNNTGGVINNLVITAPQNSSFSLDGATQKSVGSIAYNTATRVSVTLLSSSTTSTGIYSVPLVFTYQDAVKNPTEQTLYAGPVSVLETSTLYGLSIEPLTPVEVGSKAVFRLTLKNSGSSTISAFVYMNSTDVFTPIGVQRVYFDSVAPGSSASTNITVGIASSKSAGYYSFPLKLTPSTGQPITYNVGVAVDATPELIVSLETLSSGSRRIQIANTGNTAVRSVYVTVRPRGSSSGATESFIGTLNVDNFETVDVPSAIGQAIEVEIRFRDSNNIQHTITKDLNTGSNSNMTIGEVSGNQTRQLGLMGQQRSTMNILGLRIQSPDLGQIAITVVGLVLLIVGSWFAYKRFWKRRHPK
jgi:hypothetical protein